MPHMCSLFNVRVVLLMCAALSCVAQSEGGGSNTGDDGSSSGLPFTVCATNPQFNFHPASALALGGIPSAIQSAGQPVVMAVGKALPPIIIDATDISDGIVVTANMYPQPVQLSGYSVAITLGVAYFPALTLEASLPPNTTTANSTLDAWLHFTAIDDSGQEYLLSSGLVTQMDPVAAAAPASVRLLPYGYIRAQTPREIPNGYAMGQFFVGVYDSLGNLITATATASVAVASGYGGTLSPPGSTYLGNGAIGISNLIYSSPTANFTYLQITVTLGGWSGSVLTERLTPATPNVISNNEFIEFDTATSFITVDNIGATGVMNVPLPPVVINMLKSDRTMDTSNTGLVISATASQGTLVGGQALVINGVATFTNLYFSGSVVPITPVITFSVSWIAGVPLTLASGIVSLAADVILAKQMRFAPWSEITAVSPTSIGFDSSGLINLPLIVVRMYDSAFALDHTASGFDLVMSTDPPGLLSPVGGSPPSCQVQYGLCAIINATFQVTSAKIAAGRSVRFVIADNTGLSARAPLQTGDIQLINLATLNSRDATQAQVALSTCAVATPVNPLCTYYLQFVSDYTSWTSAIFQSGMALTATVGTPLDPIRIRLFDAAGQLTDLSPSFLANCAPMLYAHTGANVLQDSSLSADVATRRASLSPSGEYRFDGLVFTSVPTGLVRLQFTAVFPSFGVLGALYLQSGFLRVASAPTSLYQLRFGMSTGTLATPAILSAAEQSTTSVTNVSLPPIIVEVPDSVGVVDTGDATSPVTVVATASSTLGTANILNSVGSSVNILGGQAVFQALMLTTNTVDDVVLTFTAFQSPSALTAAPVVGQAISTGILTSTLWPVRAVTHMDLITSGTPSIPLPSTTTVITAPAQSATFVNLTNVDLYAEFAFRDSAHTVITPYLLTQPRWTGALDGITVELRSLQVGVAVTAFRPDPSCACVRVRIANLTLTSSNYLGDLIFIDIVVTTVGPKGNPYLIRNQFPVGPISLSSQTSATITSSGGGGLTADNSVIGEFALEASAFDPSIVVNDLALVMGVDTSRITFGTTYQSVSRVDPGTLQTWTGTKVTMTFSDPAPGDLNRNPGSALASQLAGYRSDCGPQGFLLKSAYLPALDQTCNTAIFDSQVATAQTCVQTGENTICECYALGLLSSNGQAQNCISDRSAQLQTICVTLTQCTDTAIALVCTNIAQPVENYTGLYVSAILIALLAAIGGVYAFFHQQSAGAQSKSFAARD